MVNYVLSKYEIKEIEERSVNLKSCPEDKNEYGVNKQHNKTTAWKTPHILGQ